jgi:hypothetical protein
MNETAGAIPPFFVSAWRASRLHARCLRRRPVDGSHDRSRDLEAENERHHIRINWTCRTRERRI